MCIYWMVSMGIYEMNGIKDGKLCNECCKVWESMQ